MPFFSFAGVGSKDLYPYSGVSNNRLIKMKYSFRQDALFPCAKVIEKQIYGDDIADYRLNTSPIYLMLLIIIATLVPYHLSGEVPKPDPIFTLDIPYENMDKHIITVLIKKERRFCFLLTGLCISFAFPNGTP